MFDYLINKLHPCNPYHGFNAYYLPKSHEIQGWHGNHKIFETLISKHKPKLILEIGSWKGQSAINMASIVKKYGLNSTIVCVDTWLGSVDFINAESSLDHDRNCFTLFGFPQVYYHFLSNVINYNHDNIIVPFPQTSSIAFQWFNIHKIQFDLIYIDGSNDKVDLQIDLDYAWKSLNHSGVMFGDDFNNQHFSDIYTTINDFSIKVNKPYVLTDDQIFWIIQKI